METIIVENRKLEVYSKNLVNSRYFVYNDKIYSFTGSEGAGVNYKLSGEKESTKERITIKADELKNVKWVIRPTGYMSV